MNRNLVSGIAVFALVVGATLATGSSAQAGHGGGLFAKLHAAKCQLISNIKAKHAAKHCCAPEPTCCEPAPEPCCAPAPEPCCAPEPAPCCEAAPVVEAPCCEAAPVVEAPCCGGEAAVMEGVSVSSEGYNLAPGETIVPGSVQTIGAATSEAVPAAPVAAPSEAAEAAAPAAEAAAPAAEAAAPAVEAAAPAADAPPAPAAATEAVDSSSDAPPVPTPDANTDI